MVRSSRDTAGDEKDRKRKAYLKKIERTRESKEESWDEMEHTRCK